MALVLAVISVNADQNEHCMFTDAQVVQLSIQSVCRQRVYGRPTAEG